MNYLVRRNISNMVIRQTEHLYIEPRAEPVKICLIFENFFSWESAVLECVETTYISSRPEVFFKKSVLRNFAKFTGIHLCQSLFLIKFHVKANNFIQKETDTGFFLLIFRDF